MEDEIKLIQKIANKIPTYNKDINQHIETCRISLSIIEQKESKIQTLREMLEQRDEQIRLIQEENLELRKRNFIERTGREISEKEYREALRESIITKAIKLRIKIQDLEYNLTLGVIEYDVSYQLLLGMDFLNKIQYNITNEGIEINDQNKLRFIERI